MKRLLGVFFCFLLLGAVSCGSSSSGDTTTSGYTVTASVALPTAASVSAPLMKDIELMSPMVSAAISEKVAEGVVVQATDLAGNDIGLFCTTDAAGECNIVLTEAQLEAGAVFESENMHSLMQPDATELAAAAAGAALAAPINAEEDMIYAIAAANCGGALGTCPPTIDIGCLREAVGVLPGNDDPGTDTVDGYVESLYMAQASALMNDPAGATSGLIGAIMGDPAPFVAAVGADTVSSANVPVADAVANSQVAASTINTAYCTRDAAGLPSPWETARAAMPAGTDAETFNMAMAGMFEYFAPSELQQGIYAPADFRGFMTAGPQLDGFFATVGGAGNDMARNAFVEGFRNGMFADPNNAPVAVGFIGSTFPSDRNWVGNAYDPSTAVMAGRNAFVEFTNSGSYNPASFTPNAVHAAFQPVLGDPTYRNSFANGGGEDFVNSFMGNPGGFVPRDFMGQIKSPPGGSCTTDADCLPCDSCANSICVAGSSKMGSTCSTDSDCDTITLCIGPPNSAYGSVAMKNCMCASAVPTGMGVYTGGGGAPQQYGAPGGYAPPSNGAQGGPCQPPPAPPCGPGMMCTGAAGSGGVCAPNTFKWGFGHSCGGNAECMSDVCTGGFCAAGASGGGTKANGQPCAFPNECQSMMCIGGICSAGGGGGALKPDCSPCSSGLECGSGNCASSICRPLGGGFPAGGFCTCNDVCLSNHCNMGTMTCGS